MACIIQGTNTGNLQLIAGTNQSIVFTTDADGSINLNALATKADLSSSVSSAINSLVAGAPTALNTLQELSAAIADDANFAGSVVSTLATKANIADVYTKTEVDQSFSAVNVLKQDKFVAAPTTSVGKVGDTAGMIAVSNSYFYYCTANYNGSSNIWARVALTLSTW